MLSLSKQERAGRVLVLRRVQDEVLVCTESYPAASAWACSSVTLPWRGNVTVLGLRRRAGLVDAGGGR